MQTKTSVTSPTMRFALMVKVGKSYTKICQVRKVKLRRVDKVVPNMDIGTKEVDLMLFLEETFKGTGEASMEGVLEPILKV